jgi:hypothetical protein
VEEYLHATKGVTTIYFRGRGQPVFQRTAARKFADQHVFKPFNSTCVEHSKSMQERGIKDFKIFSFG